ncbi:DNA polymerase III subunit chi [Moellerella wisconsensis]|uniref:DNA polymerase III subunit chi n=3 Tax=Moellerella wisconsensis TaxID=158849 RepID=A0A0N0ZBG4_9GAMM|nr:DNA polymerase III subunit chi [Moellerella wisconsensis]KLN95415.1 DNA polymerase III subunit chi [Moellerella wisconsensis]KPD04199.1 DNA polymerase III subunit chi [Moellerella wisconsensis ATCC 35017]UNH23929.1 DNA polymerase III subunit chi [Moellerella wisconsensis]UNH27011.1 DNA polymerase III subunit chi [Moellerella wisconsensis]UNH30485.1 DNA polymerase III subunit chi [Moellerella wisconsensis]
MKNAIFYLLEQPSLQEGLEAHEWLACQLAAAKWRAGKRVLIACETAEQAEKLDEALWQREPHQFVPHNLAGEGPRYGAPVELCWPQKRGNASRDVLINLQTPFADFATAFHEVIDFVPIDETLKQLARERYKIYRSVGFNLTMAAPPTY